MDSLSRFVRDVRVLVPDASSDDRVVDFVPDGTTTVIYRWFGSALDISVRGPVRRAHYKRVKPIPLAIVVVLRPGGGFPFFGVPMSELADRVTLLDELWGDDVRPLHDRLATAGGDATAAVAAIEHALVTRMRTQPFEPPAELAVRGALRRIDGGAASIASVARELGVSERTLRRGFHAAVGVGPKTYARFARFQRALAAGRAAEGRWADIAREVGYFDQAHLIADFHELARRAPTELTISCKPCEVVATGPHDRPQSHAVSADLHRQRESRPSRAVADRGRAQHRAR
jgi:AraC-like DNA-binding protein